MGVILQVALPSRVLAAARLQCGAAGAGASRGLGVCAEHARLAARGESARAMEIGDFLVGLGPGGNSQRRIMSSDREVANRACNLIMKVLTSKVSTLVSGPQEWSGQNCTARASVAPLRASSGSCAPR